MRWRGCRRLLRSYWILRRSRRRGFWPRMSANDLRKKRAPGRIDLLRTGGRIELVGRERQRVRIHAHWGREFEWIFSAAIERQLDEIGRVAFVRLSWIADEDSVLLFDEDGVFVRGSDLG